MPSEPASVVDSKSLPVIGILGGMGPAATVDLMRRVIVATPARDDIDHIHMIVDNNPKVPSRIKALIEGTGSSPLPMLCVMAQKLEIAGASVLAMPCNTAHYYYEEIRNHVSIPFLNMIELVSRRVLARPLVHRRIGLLASVAVQNLGIYRDILSPEEIEVVYTESPQDLMSVIKEIKTGDNGSALQKKYQKLVEQMAQRELDYLIVACTELSALMPLGENLPPTIDAMDVLVEEIVAWGLGAKRTGGGEQA